MGITRCIQHALAALGQPIPPAKELERFIGPPLRSGFTELLETNDDGLLADAVARYRERFEAVGMLENIVYPGIPAALEALREENHRLWVATSKPQPYALRILEHFQLASLFEAIYGSEFSGANAEKADLLRWVIEDARLDRTVTWMVGDRAHDIVGAKKAGIKSAAVLWGYGTADELKAAAPDQIVRTPVELSEVMCGV